MESLPAQSAIYRFNHRLKTSLKKTLWPGSTLFEDMGFTYLGPIDGHDLPRLCDMLTWAKELTGPVVVHVHTPSRARDTPSRSGTPASSMAIAPFDPETGLLKKASGETFSSVFGKTLSDCAGEDSRICAITAAMEEGTGLTSIRQQAYPERFFDVGIAEGHGVSMAAGMAKQGMIPVFAVYSTFLQRSYDMLVHDVALQKLHVVLGVDRAGLVGADGETHHGCLDAVPISPVFRGSRSCAPPALRNCGPCFIRRCLRSTARWRSGIPEAGEGVFNADTSTQAAVRCGRMAVRQS